MTDQPEPTKLALAKTMSPDKYARASRHAQCGPGLDDGEHYKTNYPAEEADVEIVGASKSLHTRPAWSRDPDDVR